jgi:hypothetical protein
VTTPVPTSEQLRHAQIPEGYWGVEVDDIRADETFVGVVRRYVEHLPKVRRAGSGFLLVGAHGDTFPEEQARGISVVLKAAIRGGFTVYHIEVNDLQRAIVRNAFATRDEFGDPVHTSDHVERVDFLWLGGLGLEYHREEDSFVKSAVQNLLHVRAQNRRPTLVTSYLPLTDLFARYPVLVTLVRDKHLHLVEVRGA